MRHRLVHANGLHDKSSVVFSGILHLVPGNVVLVVAAHWVPGRHRGNPTYLLVLLTDHI